MSENRIITVFIAVLSVVSVNIAYGQTSLNEKFERLGLNTITTAVPFLVIAPDSRAGAMGDAGVATKADANSIHWNPAKMAFTDNEMSFSLSYIPWLRQLVPDIDLAYLSGYKKIDKYQTFGASFLYFSLGDIQFMDEYGSPTIQVNPKEFALDVSYSRLLSERLSGGLALRYINSNLTGAQLVQGTQSKPGRAVAMDVSVYYENDEIKIAEKDAELAFGMNISNIGNRMSYTSSAKRDFIPINLRFGPRLTLDLDDFNSLTLAIDVNKLLVPTPPLYLVDGTGQPILDSNGDYIIMAGADPDRAVAAGMFGSFSDAPGVPVVDENEDIVFQEDGIHAEIENGSVFKEEMREFNYSVGLEYWYGTQFAIRSGYFWEHALKGNRKYFTLGAGLKYNVFSLDFAYLIPAYFNAATVQKSPLQNTLRFTLAFDFDAFKAQSEGAPAGE